MSEKSKFVAYKKKLQGICDENNFVFRFRQDRYPITLTIKPATGVDEQMSLLEKAEDTNVTSPDASLVFMVLDGDLKYKISDTFTISETLFNKLKNLFKNMHYYWLQYFFREIILRFAKGMISPDMMPVINDEDESAAGGGAGTSTEAEGDGESTVTPEEVVQAAIAVVREHGYASAALLQRRMQIGYNLAAALLDRMEDMGVVGPFRGDEPREVLPWDDDADEGEDE